MSILPIIASSRRRIQTPFTPLDPKWNAIGVYDALSGFFATGGANPVADGGRVEVWTNQLGESVLTNALQETWGSKPTFLPRSEFGGYALFANQSAADRVGNGLQVPLEAALGGFTEVDFIASAALDEWAWTDSQAFINHKDTYAHQVTNSGRIQLVLFDQDDVLYAVSSTTPIPVADGSHAWTRSTWSAATGKVNFYYSFDAPDTDIDSINWIQLGTPDQAMVMDSVFAARYKTNVGYVVDGLNTTDNLLAGRFYRGVIRNSIGGDIVLDINVMKDAPHEALTFTASSGQEVTVWKTGPQPIAILKNTTLRTDRAAAFMAATFASAQTMPLIVFTVFTPNPVPGSGRTISLQKATDATDDASVGSIAVGQVQASGIASYYNGSEEFDFAGGTLPAGVRAIHELDILASGSVAYLNGVPSATSATDFSGLSIDALNIAAAQASTTPTFSDYSNIDLEAIYIFPDPGSEGLRQQLRDGVANYDANTADLPTPTKLFSWTSDVHIDYGNANDAQLRFDDIAPDIGASGASFFFSCGDFIDLGPNGLDAQDLTDMRASLATIGGTQMFNFGNHDNADGDSATDITPQQVIDYYAAVEQPIPTGGEMGYYYFESDGIYYIVLNSVELQAPAEGDYDISTTQKNWLTATLAALPVGARLVVFSHVDPWQTTPYYGRMLDSARTFIQTSLSAWVATPNSLLLAVISGHEHGTFNNSQNRQAEINGVHYWNMIDGLNASNVSNIKTLPYEDGARKSWWIAEWTESTRIFTLKGQNGASSLSRVVT